jgi:hypothetical protein
VIKEPLDEAPGLNATAQDREEYCEARDIVIRVQTLMLSSTEHHLKAHYEHRDPYSMINALRSHFAPQVRKQEYDCLNEFFTTKMDENTFIKSHLSNMHMIYRRLVDEFDYEMTDDIGKDVVLQSLTPSYATLVEGYVMAEFKDKGRASCLRDRRSDRYMWYTML